MVNSANAVLMRDAALETNANLARRAAADFIGQVVKVPAGSVPLLKEVVGELISAGAEKFADGISHLIPIEEGFKAGGHLAEYLRGKFNLHLDAVIGKLFNPQRPNMLQGDTAELVKAAEKIIRTRIEAKIRESEGKDKAVKEGIKGR